MEPKLYSIKVDDISETKSVIEIKYIAPAELHGIELMGVDADLSWIKGESIELKRGVPVDEKVIHTTHLQLDDSCEFRARGFTEDEDIWEQGIGNHRLDRNEDGTIDIVTELNRGKFSFHPGPPTDYNPVEKDYIKRIENLDNESPTLYQILIDIHYWSKSLFSNPLDENKIHKISQLIRYIKKKMRLKESFIIDEEIRPIISALFGIYTSAMAFAEDDERLLVGQWEREGYEQILKDIPQKVKKLENSRIGVSEDSGKRFRSLLKYN